MPAVPGFGPAGAILAVLSMHAPGRVRAGGDQTGDEVDFDKIRPVHSGNFADFPVTLGEARVAVRGGLEELVTSVSERCDLVCEPVMPRPLCGCKDFKRDNTTPKRHYGTGASESNSSTRDRSYLEHEALRELAEVFATIDQLNCASLFGYEKLIRRITAIEEAQGEPGSTPSWGSAELLNEGRSKGGARIAPAVFTFLVKKQTERNAVLGEKRKAEEHRRLKPKPKGGGRGGAEDHG